MPRGAVVQALPFVPFLAGFLLSVWRFRGHDPLGGIACAVGGVILMVVTVFRLPGPSNP